MEAAPRPRLPQWRLRLIAVVVSTTACLLVAELAVRMTVDEARWRPRQPYDNWVADPELGWTQAPDLHARWADDKGRARVLDTNEDGLLPASAHRQRGAPLRVLLVGDSAVAGVGVLPHERLHSQLEAMLGKGGARVEVLNAAVEGYSTDQVVLRMQRLLPRYRPDVVVNGFCTNDLGGNAVSVAYEWPKPRFRVDANGHIRGPEPPPAIAADHAPVAGPRAWIQHSALYRFLRPYTLGLRARLGGWNAENLFGHVSPYYLDPKALDAADWQLFSALLVRMRDAAVQSGAAFTFFSYPSPHEVWEPAIEAACRRAGVTKAEYDRKAVERRLLDIAHRTGTSFVPLIDYFLAHRDEGPFHLLPRDPHNNAAGYRLIAQAIAPTVSQLLREEKENDSAPDGGVERGVDGGVDSGTD